jgi:hypothetical protein
VIDRFHLVQLAGDAVTEVRRRVTMTTRGRRGRGSDPEWPLRNLLRRNREYLSDRGFTKLWNTLIDLGGPELTILRAWIAKDLFRQVLALTGTGVDRSVISHRLYRFYTWCADADVPELERFATTISTWWRYIERCCGPGSRMLETGATTGSSNSTPGTRSDIGTPQTSAYEHAAQPPAEPADASTPINFDEPLLGAGERRSAAIRRRAIRRIRALKGPASSQ